jgi:hypothetical protein
MFRRWAQRSFSNGLCIIVVVFYPSRTALRKGRTDPGLVPDLAQGATDKMGVA